MRTDLRKGLRRDGGKKKAAWEIGGLRKAKIHSNTIVASFLCCLFIK